MNGSDAGTEPHDGWDDERSSMIACADDVQVTIPEAEASTLASIRDATPDSSDSMPDREATPERSARAKQEVTRRRVTVGGVAPQSQQQPNRLGARRHTDYGDRDAFETVRNNPSEADLWSTVNDLQASFAALDANSRMRRHDHHENARKGHLVHNCPPEEWLAGVHCVSENHRARIDMERLIQPFAKPRRLPSEWSRPDEVNIREFPLYSMPCFELEEPSVCSCEGLRKFATWQVNGVLFNRRNKDLYLQLASKLGALRKRVDGMHDQLYSVTNHPAVTSVAGKDADMDHLVLKSEKTLIEAGAKMNNWKVLMHGVKGSSMIVGDKAKKMDEAAEEALPGFLSRFLGELIITYQELDMILMDKRKIEPAALFDFDEAWDPKRLQYVKTSTCGCCRCRCCANAEKMETRRDERQRMRREDRLHPTLCSLCACDCDGSHGHVVNDVNDVLFFSKAPLNIFYQDYHLVRDNMRRHMKLPESLKVTKARRTAVELMQRELELRELFCSGGSDHIFLGDAEQAAQLKHVPKSSHNLNGMFESTDGESVDGKYLGNLSARETPHFNSLLEFEQWHLHQLEAHLAKMRLLCTFMHRAIDKMDEMKFKILLVFGNVLLALGSGWWNLFLSTTLMQNIIDMDNSTGVD